MKLGAIIWGLPENYNFTVYNKLGKILKTITESQLTKIGIHKEHTLWLGSCYETELTLPKFIDTSQDIDGDGNVDIFNSDKGNSNIGNVQHWEWDGSKMRRK